MEIRFHFGEKSLYRMINAAFLTYLVLSCAGGYFGIASVGVVHILVATVTVVLLTMFQAFSAKGRILLGLGVAGCLGAVTVAVGLQESAWFTESYVKWLFGAQVAGQASGGGAGTGSTATDGLSGGGISGVLPQEEWLTGYEIMQVLLIVLICYFVQMILEKEFRIKLAGALLLVAGLGYCFLSETEVPRGGMALAVCYPVLVFMEWTQLHWKKEKSKSVQAYMLWMTPFVVIYLIVLLCMPVPEKPYDWQIFKDAYAKISESVRTVSMNVFSIGREDFDTGLSGFSEKGGLKSGILDSEREIMTIQSDSGLKTNVYLMGKVYDSFDGIQWQQKNEENSYTRFLDTVRTMYAIRRYDRDYQQDYIYRTTLNIRYEDFRTKYLLAPLKIYSLEYMDRPVEFEESGDSFYFVKKKGYGTEYDAIYYQLNMGQESFYEFLEMRMEEDDTLLQEVLMNIGSRMDMELTKADLEKQEQRIYETYLGEVTLSAKTQNYLEQITKDAETDVERLRAIEQALSDEDIFTYTKSPGELPDDVTDGSRFLDYFLLESRQGYCSYFSTAFVLLARAEGIPARYVQGYCVPMEADEAVTVTSEMAHAWPEVYLDDIGWIPFEPTPGYAELRYTPWTLKKGETVIKADTSGYYADTWETEEEETEETEEMPENLTATELTQETAGSIDLGKLFGVLGASLALVLAATVIMIFVERLIGRYRYHKMNEEQKYLAEIRKNFKILAWLSVERKEGETLEELQERAGIELHFLNQYESFLYGNRKADGEMIQLVKEEQTGLLHILKEKRRPLYWYYRIWR